MSSSPNLPSPSRLFSKKQASSLGDSHAVSLPIDGLAEFTSASKLLLQAHASDHSEDDPIETRKKLGEKTNTKNLEGKSVKPRKLPVGEGESVVNVVKKARAPKKTPGESGKATEKNEIQDSKKRGRKSKGEVQAKIEKGNITKPGALNNEKTKLVASARNLKKTDQSVTQASIKKIEEIFPSGEEPLDLGLIEAIKRRKAWTPVKDTVRCTSPLKECGTTPSAELILKDCVSGQSGPSRFKNLLGDYGYAKDDNIPVNDPAKTRDTDGQASTKRRKIEVS